MKNGKSFHASHKKVFMVSSNSTVQLQESVKRSTSLKVESYPATDYEPWKMPTFSLDMQSSQVIFMPPKVFLNCIREGYIDIVADVSFIIMECGYSVDWSLMDIVDIIRGIDDKTLQPPFTILYDKSCFKYRENIEDSFSCRLSKVQTGKQQFSRPSYTNLEIAGSHSIPDNEYKRFQAQLEEALLSLQASNPEDNPNHYLTKTEASFILSVSEYVGSESAIACLQTIAYSIGMDLPNNLSILDGSISFINSKFHLLVGLLKNIYKDDTTPLPIIITNNSQKIKEISYWDVIIEGLKHNQDWVVKRVPNSKIEYQILCGDKMEIYFVSTMDEYETLRAKSV